MKLTEAYPSRWLSKEDVGRKGMDLTIKEWGREEVRTENGLEQKNVVRFQETDKGLIVSKTNAMAIGALAETDDTDQCIGKTFNFYHDPTVSMGGRPVGGIRVREAKGQPF